MATQTKPKTDDASGRGAVKGFKVNFPPMLRPYTQAEKDAVLEVMNKGEGQTQGEYLRKFEAAFTEYTGANHAFAVDNCTNALRLAALLCGVGAGDEVIIPAYTFCATAIPFGMTGATIVWADIHADTWNVDPKDVERKITDRTKAIVVVHLLGMPADMPAILKLAQKHNLRVVEDCAQAPGASINGKQCGTWGDFGCFSFQSAKNMTTLGEGSMLTVRSEEDAKFVPKLRHNGCCAFERAPEDRYWLPAMSNVDVDTGMEMWPNNFCIGEAQCALGIEALKSLDQTNDTLIAQRQKIIAVLADTPEIEFAKTPVGYRHIAHQFIMHFDGSAFGKTRDDLMDVLTCEHGLRCIVQYHPLYRYPLFQKLGAGKHDCPVLESWWDNSFSFPWYAGMDDQTIEYLTSCVKAAIAKLKG